MRVVSLIPNATDTVIALGLEGLLVGRSHECDWAQLASVPALTSSRIGAIPVEEIDAAFSASVAAVKEMQSLGPALAVPLLQYALSVYALDVESLARIRPDVVLTCLQTAHSAVLEGELLDAALHAALGYAPKVVHCLATDMDGVWRDMQAIADALGVSEQGKELIVKQQRQMSGASASALGRPRPRVACIQWPRPLMASCSWVPQLLEMTGGQDVCGKVEEAVILAAEDVKNAAPDIVIFALCGLSLDKALQAAKVAMQRMGHVWEDLPAVKNGRIAVVDGEHVFSRPGPLLAPSVETLVEILHPEAQRYGHEGALWKWLPSGAS